MKHLNKEKQEEIMFKILSLLVFCPIDLILFFLLETLGLSLIWRCVLILVFDILGYYMFSLGYKCGGRE